MARSQSPCLPSFSVTPSLGVIRDPSSPTFTLVLSIAVFTQQLHTHKNPRAHRRHWPPDSQDSVTDWQQCLCAKSQALRLTWLSYSASRPLPLQRAAITGTAKVELQASFLSPWVIGPWMHIAITWGTLNAWASAGRNCDSMIWGCGSL